MSKKHTGPNGITEDKAKILKDCLTKIRNIAKEYSDDDGDIAEDLFDKIVELVTESAQNKNRSDIIQFKVRLSNLRTSTTNLQESLSDAGKTTTLKIIDAAIATVNTFYERGRGLIKKTTAEAGGIVQDKFDSIIHGAKHALSPDNIIKEAFEFNPFVSMGVDFVTEKLHERREKKKELVKNLASDVKEVTPRTRNKSQGKPAGNNKTHKTKSTLGPLPESNPEQLARIAPPEEVVPFDALSPEALADEKYEKLQPSENQEDETQKAEFMQGLQEGISEELKKIDPSGFMQGVAEGMMDEFKKLSTEGAGTTGLSGQETEKLLVRIDEDLIEIYDTASNSEKLLEKIVGFEKDTADSNKIMANLEQKKDAEKEIADLSTPESNAVAPLVAPAVAQNKSHNTIFDKLTESFTNFGKQKTESITEGVVKGNVITGIASAIMGIFPITAVVAASAAALGLGYTYRQQLFDAMFGPWRDVKSGVTSNAKKYGVDDWTASKIALSGSWISKFKKAIGLPYMAGIDLVKKKYGEEAAFRLSKSEMGQNLLEEIGRTGNINILNDAIKQINDRVQDDPRTDRFSSSGNASEKVKNVQEVRSALAYVAHEQSKTGQRIYPMRARDARVMRQSAAALERYNDAINSAAKLQGIDPSFLKSIILGESGGNPNAIGDNGAAVGLGQLHRDAAADVGLSPEDRLDPIKNINATAAYIKQKLDEWGGDYTMAAAAFNQGTGAMRGSNARKKQLGLDYGMRAINRAEGINLQSQQAELDSVRDSRQKVAMNSPNLSNQNLNNISTQNVVHNYGSEMNETATRVSDWLHGKFSPTSRPD